MKDKIAHSQTLQSVRNSVILKHMQSLCSLYAQTIRVEKRASLVASFALAAGARVVSAVRSTTGTESPAAASRRKAERAAEREALRAKLQALRAQRAALESPAANESDQAADDEITLIMDEIDQVEVEPETAPDMTS